MKLCLCLSLVFNLVITEDTLFEAEIDGQKILYVKYHKMNILGKKQ